MKMIKIINTIKNKLKQYDKDRCDHIILNVIICCKIFNILKIYVNVIFFIFLFFQCSSVIIIYI